MDRKDAEPTIEKLVELGIPVETVSVMNNAGLRAAFEIPIFKNEERSTKIKFHSYNSIENWINEQGSYTDSVRLTKEDLEKDVFRALRDNLLIYKMQFLVEIQDTKEGRYYEWTRINEVTGNCGMLAITGIPAFRTKEEWEWFNKFLKNTFSRKGLIIASHNEEAIKGPLKLMVESGWKVGEYIFNPNSHNNIALLQLHINQPRKP